MRNKMKKLFSKVRSTKGFTLVEMIVVMAIIGILVALLAPNVATLIKDAQDTSNDAKVKNVMTTLAAYNTKMIKDGYSFQGMTAVTGKVEPIIWGSSTTHNGSIITVHSESGANPINTAVRNLWKDASGTISAVEYVGTSSGYLPANVLNGTELMYIYLTKEGNVLGVVYVDANTYVKAANTTLSVGDGGITVAGATTGVINSALIRDMKATASAGGKAFVN